MGGWVDGWMCLWDDMRHVSNRSFVTLGQVVTMAMTMTKRAIWQLSRQGFVPPTERKEKKKKRIMTHGLFPFRPAPLFLSFSLSFFPFCFPRTVVRFLFFFLS